MENKAQLSLPDWFQASSVPSASGEAYLVNLSDCRLAITALLPDDAEDDRSLQLRVLKGEKGVSEPDALLDAAAREQTLQPGEIAQFTLRRLPTGTHTSLFRLRKEGAPASGFLKYTVELSRGNFHGSILAVGSRAALGPLEQKQACLLCIH